MSKEVSFSRLYELERDSWNDIRKLGSSIITLSQKLDKPVAVISAKEAYIMAGCLHYVAAKLLIQIAEDNELKQA